MSQVNLFGAKCKHQSLRHVQPSTACSLTTLVHCKVSLGRRESWGSGRRHTPQPPSCWQCAEIRKEACSCHHLRSQCGKWSRAGHRGPTLQASNSFLQNGANNKVHLEAVVSRNEKRCEWLLAQETCPGYPRLLLLPLVLLCPSTHLSTAPPPKS